MMRTRCGLVLAVILMTVNVQVIASERGTTSADFLKIGPGAQATGMGEANTARMGAAVNAFYNPAGLAQVPITQISATHLNWIGETRYEALSFAQPLLGIGTLGASIFALHMPAIPSLDNNGLDTGMLEVYDLGMQGSYARNIGPLVGLTGLIVGANLKFLYRQLADLNALGGAMDLGVIWSIIDTWSVGVAVQNLGYLSSFDTAAETLPVIVRLGTHYQYKINSNQALTTGLDVVQSLDNDTKANVGLEYGFANMLFLRCGYKLGYDTDTFQAGLGISYQRYTLDYAIKDMGVFGLTHFITASIGIGSSVKSLQLDKVKEMLNQAEAEYSKSNYRQALDIVHQAVLVSPANKRATKLKNKLETVIKMLDMSASPQNQPLKVNQDGMELTPDELEELDATSTEEVQ